MAKEAGQHTVLGSLAAWKLDIVVAVVAAELQHRLRGGVRLGHHCGLAHLDDRPVFHRPLVRPPHLASSRTRSVCASALCVLHSHAGHS